MSDELKVTAWITDGSLRRLKPDRNFSRDTVPVHARKSMISNIGLVLRTDAERLLAERDARIARVEAALLGKDWTTAAPHVVHEYRLHRPINWRTGVPDAETRRRHGGLFALLLGDGSTLRECYSRPDGKWRWNGSGTGARIINPHVAEVLWCPEGEMPEGGA